ncbi:homocysteine-responsive endoplasmic reticulum-resident ubiquitin-like domain member 2 protein [Dreissena polymorpha]|uniref:Ubiquitin-like domain-containing protein n=1 Tax=Dreissena polymorpha TaxID=45954 RepID=A0A9D4BF85_DREPO|nr:homocysteine-responsive endoplasmic reticulum-resident ubiquitin-like domain member 2 protein [Dreissena polymorpha]KAH3692542.1 hypothetical protein DPMN_193091 [Dreissena polymorpha]
MDPSVTLVIKAPNQRFEDHTVDCMLDWTVRKLKQHLKDVYPTQPNEKHQRLIYSGKLLQDHLTLKEVLRQFDDGSTRHTVHLVCSNSPTHMETMASQSTMESLSQSSLSSSSSSTNLPYSAPTDTSGLRHRGQPTAQSAQIPNAYSYYSAYMNQASNPMPTDYSQFAGMMAPDATVFGAVPPTGYSPEQYMWMQQMYAQYMAQYMQYYQQGTYIQQPLLSQPEAQPNVAAEEHNRPNQPENQNVVNDAEEDEVRNRDWLDYLYMFSRLLVLIGIVYFYSNFTRFFMVAGFFVVVYGFQMGWFNFGQRRARRPQQVHIHQQQENLNEPQDNNQQENNQSENNPNQTQEENVQDPSTVIEPQPLVPGKLQVAFTFIASLFTSLFPAPPPAVNVN